VAAAAAARAATTRQRAASLSSRVPRSPSKLGAFLPLLRSCY
jgi:hypothetical protein